MPSWLLKASIQGAISVLPWRDRLNRVLQERATGSLALDEAAFEVKVGQCRRHLDNHRLAARGAGPPVSALELGTGWYPVVPVGLALAGVTRVVTIDVKPLLEPERVRRVLDLYRSYASDGRLAQLLPLDKEAVSRLNELADRRGGGGPAALLADLGIEVAVRDARASGLRSSSIDLSVSNNTFEHVPAGVLAGILGELRRVASAGGVSDHFIDMSDHYAHFDHSITEFNFLRYSDPVWRPLNNRLQYQNRLRLPDYRRLVEDAGFAIVAVESERGSGSELDRTPLAPRFRDYSHDDLLPLRGWVTAVADKHRQRSSEGGG